MKRRALRIEEAKISDTKTFTEEEVLNPSTNHKIRGPEFNGPVECQ
jgi:hypothetical protein